MSYHPHVPPSYFRDLRAHLPPQTRSTLLAFQSATVCCACRDVLDGWLSTQPLAPDREVRLLRGILGTVPPDDELAAARRQATELARLPNEELRPTLWRAQSRFRSPALVAVLLARSCDRLTTSSEDAATLALVAAAAAKYMARPDLEALALAYAANGRRTDGWLDEADVYLGQATDRLTVTPGPPSPWIEAELASLAGSLNKDHRHLLAASQRLNTARLGFQRAGDVEAVARVQMNLAAVHRLADSPDHALSVLHAALAGLDPFADLALFLRALHNLSLYLSDAGQPGKARDLLDLLAPLYERFPATQVRRRWLAGVVARELNDLRVAEDHLRTALGGFIHDDSPVYASLVALDLSELLLLEHRSTEVEDITRDLPVLFEQLDVRPEAAAAMLLFHKAAACNQLTQRLVAHLRDFLERARVDRKVQFSPPI